MKNDQHSNFDTQATSPQGTARCLLFVDGLCGFLYTLLRYVFANTSKIRLPNESQPLVIKLMGLGSLTKFASLCEKHKVDKEKIRFTTFEPNRELCTLLGFTNTFFIRTSGIVSFVSDCLLLIIDVSKNKYPYIIDYERCSNAVGIFRLFLCWIGRSQSICFEDIRQDHIQGRLSAFSIRTMSFEAMFEKGIAFLPVTVFSASKIKVEIAVEKVVVNVNVSNYLLARRYPKKYFVELIELLHQTYPELIYHLTGSDKEHPYVEELTKELHLKNIPAHNEAGRFTLEQLCQELSTARLFITCDSGPLHMAAHLGVSTLAIWGPTHFGHFGYDRLPHLTNCALELSCSPCFLHPYSKPAVACGGKITCLKDLTPALVFKKASLLLNEKIEVRTIQLLHGMIKKNGVLTDGQLI